MQSRGRVFTPQTLRRRAVMSGNATDATTLRMYHYYLGRSQLKSHYIHGKLMQCSVGTTQLIPRFPRQAPSSSAETQASSPPRLVANPSKARLFTRINESV